MLTVNRRLRKLKCSLGLGRVETAFSRRLRERLDAGRRRVVASVGRAELTASVELSGAQMGPRTIVGILQRGRQRARLAQAGDAQKPFSSNQ